jgi:hypothetical protein
MRRFRADASSMRTMVKVSMVSNTRGGANA